MQSMSYNFSETFALRQMRKTVENTKVFEDLKLLDYSKNLSRGKMVTKFLIIR